MITESNLRSLIEEEAEKIDELHEQFEIMGEKTLRDNKIGRSFLNVQLAYYKSLIQQQSRVDLFNKNFHDEQIKEYQEVLNNWVESVESTIRMLEFIPRRLIGFK